MDTLGIAVLGAGLIGQTHLAAIAATPRFRLAGVVDPAAAAPMPRASSRAEGRGRRFRGSRPVSSVCHREGTDGREGSHRGRLARQGASLIEAGNASAVARYANCMSRAFAV